jgi:hypothetical protein
VAGGGLTQPVFVDVRPRLTRHGGKSVSVLHQEVEEDEPEPEAPEPALPMPAAFMAPGEEALAADDGDGDEADYRRDELPAALAAATPMAAPSQQSMAPLAEMEDELPARRPEPVRQRSPLPGTPEAWNAALLDDMLPPPRTLARRAAPAEPVLEFEADESPFPVFGSETPLIKPTPVRKSWTPADAREIQRVAVRLGAVPAGQDPQRSLDVLWDLAREHRDDPDERLRLYREVAAHICHPQTPACIRCPLRDHCAYHDGLKQERQKTRGAFRRLWGA